MSIPENELKQIAKIVRYMAESGLGTDHCLEEGCLPLLVHFYSPVPDIKELDRRKIWEKISPLRGVRMQAESQILLLSEMARRFSPECNWSRHGAADSHEYYFDNNCFSFQCASLLHYMVRYFQPRRIIEAGSGHSSRVINGALARNKAEGAPACQYHIIDPFPADSTKTLPYLTKIDAVKVEEIPESMFSELESGDILFIDSGHVVKIGADVNFLVLDILPLLKPGVVIHFHDIAMPREYSRTYYTNPAFRMLWTESYLLQAFLAFNHEFEVLGSVSYLATHHPESLKKIFPGDPGVGGSQSIWLRRVSCG